MENGLKRHHGPLPSGTDPVFRATYDRKTGGLVALLFRLCYLFGSPLFESPFAPGAVKDPFLVSGILHGASPLDVSDRCPGAGGGGVERCDGPEPPAGPRSVNRIQTLAPSFVTTDYIRRGEGSGGLCVCVLKMRRKFLLYRGPTSQTLLELEQSIVSTHTREYTTVKVHTLTDKCLFKFQGRLNS